MLIKYFCLSFFEIQIVWVFILIRKSGYSQDLPPSSVGPEINQIHFFGLSNIVQKYTKKYIPAVR